jgi:hypothetical protein
MNTSSTRRRRTRSSTRRRQTLFSVRQPSRKPNQSNLRRKTYYEHARHSSSLNPQVRKLDYVIARIDSKDYELAGDLLIPYVDSYERSNKKGGSGSRKGRSGSRKKTQKGGAKEIQYRGYTYMAANGADCNSTNSPLAYLYYGVAAPFEIAPGDDNDIRVANELRWGADFIIFSDSSVTGTRNLMDKSNDQINDPIIRYARAKPLRKNDYFDRKEPPSEMLTLVFRYGNSWIIEREAQGLHMSYNVLLRKRIVDPAPVSIITRQALLAMTQRQIAEYVTVRVGDVMPVDEMENCVKAVIDAAITGQDYNHDWTLHGLMQVLSIVPYFQGKPLLMDNIISVLLEMKAVANANPSSSIITREKLLAMSQRQIAEFVTEKARDLLVHRVHIEECVNAVMEAAIIGWNYNNDWDLDGLMSVLNDVPYFRDKVALRPHEPLRTMDHLKNRIVSVLLAMKALANATPVVPSIVEDQSSVRTLADGTRLVQLYGSQPLTVHAPFWWHKIMPVMLSEYESTQSQWPQGRIFAERRAINVSDFSNLRPAMKLFCTVVNSYSNAVHIPMQPPMEQNDIIIQELTDIVRRELNKKIVSCNYSSIPSTFASDDTHLTFCEFAAILFFTQPDTARVGRSFSTYSMLRSSMCYNTAKDLTGQMYCTNILCQSFIVIFYSALKKCPPIGKIFSRGLLPPPPPPPLGPPLPLGLPIWPPPLKYLHRFLPVPQAVYEHYAQYDINSIVTFYCFQSFSLHLNPNNVGPFTQPTRDKTHLILLRILINAETSARYISHYSAVEHEEEILSLPCTPYMVSERVHFNHSHEFRDLLHRDTGFYHADITFHGFQSYIIMTLIEEHDPGLVNIASILNG